MNAPVLDLVVILLAILFVGIFAGLLFRWHKRSAQKNLPRHADRLIVRNTRFNRAERPEIAPPGFRRDEVRKRPKK